MFAQRKLLVLTAVAFAFATLNAQTYTLTVTNGYGSGTFHAGDTAHVWSIAYDTMKTFDYWGGDTSVLQDSHEWHSTLIMPARNVAVTAHVHDMPAYAIHYEKIRGRDTLKNVYSFFPQTMKGVVYLLHGTGGAASNFINGVEWRSYTDAAIAGNYGIISTEAEEITLGDLNGDGKLRWALSPYDSVDNVDYANIKAITDTFVNRGSMTRSTPRFSLGMSNGGAFSATLSAVYKYKAGISYCASSTSAIFQVSTTPFAFRMALYDDNPQVGPVGDHQAWQNDSVLAARGVCHQYLLHDRQPLYPERFARIPGISVTLSQNIFNELRTNNQIDAKGFAISSDSIAAHVAASAASYPVISTLRAGQQQALSAQIAASNAQHQMFSDWNYASLDFFNDLCGTAAIAEVPRGASLGNDVRVSLDLGGKSITMHSAGDFEVELMNASGQMIRHTHTTRSIDVSDLRSGIYCLRINTVGRCYSRTLVKQ